MGTWRRRAFVSLLVAGILLQAALWAGLLTAGPGVLAREWVPRLPLKRDVPLLPGLLANSGWTALVVQAGLAGRLARRDP